MWRLIPGLIFALPSLIREFRKTFEDNRSDRVPVKCKNCGRIFRTGKGRSVCPCCGCAVVEIINN